LQANHQPRERMVDHQPADGSAKPMARDVGLVMRMHRRRMAGFIETAIRENGDHWTELFFGEDSWPWPMRVLSNMVPAIISDLQTVTQ
jgi:hypothetical protein